jgi:2,4-dienoyl-CoA reductase-like NADH-dependent reductase (Old Yellow Enzyme family)
MQNLDSRERTSKADSAAGLFEDTTINGMNLANRFVRSATWEGLADKEGSVSKRLTEMMVELARGEVGLIISGYTFISPEGQSSPGQMAVYDDRFLPGLHDMAAAVHSAGGKIALQLVHGGCYANSDLTGLELVGPSAVRIEGRPECRAAGKEEISAVVSAFARSAGRARDAGFDAIQIHAAHGFLLNQFLSPAFNKRTDEYGGGLENRARFLLEVVGSVRETVGPGYPVIIKLNSEDFLDGGMTRDEAIQVSILMEQASVDAIEFSGGTVASPVEFMPPRPGRLQTPEREVFYREAARLYKQKVSIPLILVGGIRSYEVAEELVRDGLTDYISLSRPLICEPGLVRRWREGYLRASECVSDNACFAPASDGSGIYCVTMAKKRSKAGG